MHRLMVFKSFIQRISLYLCTLCMFILIPMMLLTSVDVLGRAVFNQPVPGTVEISSYMMAMFIFTGVAYTHQARGQIYVELLLNHIPPFAAKIVNILTALLSLFIIALLTWQGWLEGIEDKTVSDMLRIPRWPFKMLVPVAGFLLCLEIVIDLAHNIHKLTDKGS